MDAIREWRSVTLPPEVRTVVTMLSMEERQFLYAMGRDYWTGEGAIIYAGCFLGGSTLALGMGVQANSRGLTRRGAIYSYDLFVADAHQAGSYLKKFGTFAAGDSVRPIFDWQTREVASLLEVHEGDVRNCTWPAEVAIDVLFIDLAKTWSINDVIVREFFPALVPGRSIVIQQDYVHPTCPWLAVTMEHLADYFEPLAYVPGNSMIYGVRQAVPHSAVDDAQISRLSDEQKRDLLDRAIAKAASVLPPDDLVELEAARALFLLSVLGPERAREDIARIRAQYATSRRMPTAVGWVEKRLV